MSRKKRRSSAGTSGGHPNAQQPSARGGAEEIMHNTQGDLEIQVQATDSDPHSVAGRAVDRAAGVVETAAAVNAATVQAAPDDAATVQAATAFAATECAATDDAGADDAATESFLIGSAEVAGPSPGTRLRMAREATGLGREEFARKARIPLAVLGDLETDSWSRLGPAVYVRGYVRSYSRAAGINEASIVESLAAVADVTPVLVAARVTPARPQWVSRYATPIAYALLTGMVMVPMVYLARPAPRQVAAGPALAALDAPAMSSSMQSGHSIPAKLTTQFKNLAIDPAAAEADQRPAQAPATLVVAPDADVAAAPSSSAPRPVMASLASMPEPQGQLVRLRLRESSWVEFIAADGKRLEYALLPAGTDREYRVAGSAQLRIGNSRGVALEIDHKAVDLVDFSRANVATLNVGRAPGQRAN